MPNLTVDPQPDTLTSSDPVSVKMASHNFSRSILIGILIFVLLSATAYGAYWYTKSYLVTPSSQPVISSVPSVNSQPKTSFSSLDNQATPAATDETSSWKIYTNKKYGYSFKYPPGWFIYPEGAQSTGGENTTSLSSADITRTYTKASLSITRINVEVDSLIGSLEDYLKRVLPGNVLSRRSIVVSGVSGEDRISEGEGKTRSVSLPFAGRVYGIYGSADADNSVFDQILSTFKFL